MRVLQPDNYLTHFFRTVLSRQRFVILDIFCISIYAFLMKKKEDNTAGVNTSTMPRIKDFKQHCFRTFDICISICIPI